MKVKINNKIIYILEIAKFLFIIEKNVVVECSIVHCMFDIAFTHTKYCLYKNNSFFETVTTVFK